MSLLLINLSPRHPWLLSSEQWHMAASIYYSKLSVPFTVLSVRFIIQGCSQRKLLCIPVAVSESDIERS